MSNEPKFLVVDGYRKEGRAELAAGGATPAGELYSKTLKKCHPGCVVDIIYPADAGVSMPEGTSLAAYDGIAWTGSSLTAYHDTPEVTAQIEFCRAAFEARVPSFGSCWAAQIAAVAAGGRCEKNPRGREMGIARKIALTPEGRGHPLYDGKPTVFDAFISHEDEVTQVPAGGVTLAGNAFSRVQALAITHKGGTLWAVQYHPEYDLHEIARLTYCRLKRLTGMGFFADEDAGRDYVNKLEALYQDPSRKDLAWLLGVDDDVMNEDVRLIEVRNWIQRLVLPSMRA